MTVYHVDSVEEYASLKGLVDQLVIAEFTAEWCGPCKRMAPLLDKLAEEYPKVIIISVDIDKLGDDIDDARDVTAIPTFKYFINNELQDTVTGANVNRIKLLLQTHLPKA